MINIFTTGPKFIQGYMETKKFTALRPQLEKLREEGKLEEERELIHEGQKRWVESVSQKLKITYEVVGEENVPDASEGPFMIYSNHQGFADIPATLWLMKDHGQLGYVAKEEWRRFKILYEAIEFTRSIFLIRDNPKEAVRALSEAKKILSKGFNLIIFPEGTRSQGHKMGEFKAGAFKFAEKAGVPILPVTIDGSYKLFEEKGNWQPCHIKVTAHPLVHIEQMSKEEQKAAQAEIEAVIRSALDPELPKSEELDAPVEADSVLETEPKTPEEETVSPVSESATAAEPAEVSEAPAANVEPAEASEAPVAATEPAEDLAEAAE